MLWFFWPQSMGRLPPPPRLPRGSADGLDLYFGCQHIDLTCMNANGRSVCDSWQCFNFKLSRSIKRICPYQLFTVPGVEFSLFCTFCSETTVAKLLTQQNCTQWTGVQLQLVLIGVIRGRRKSSKPEYNLRIFFFQKGGLGDWIKFPLGPGRSPCRGSVDEPGRRYAE